LCMGEAAEQIPIVILRGFEGLKFSDTASMKDFIIAPEDDLYSPLLDVMSSRATSRDPGPAGKA